MPALGMWGAEPSQVWEFWPLQLIPLWAGVVRDEEEGLETAGITPWHWGD